MKRVPLPLRILRGRPRLFAGVLAGILAFVVIRRMFPAAIGTVLAWDIGSIVYLVLMAILVARPSRDISQDARRQQEGEWSIFALTLSGAVASFLAIFVFSGSGHHAHKSLYLVFVSATLALAWLTTHVTFAFRYAHEYYTREWARSDGMIEKGIDFPGDEPPDYFDFVYFAFVLGMTFQVSDCDITSKKMRRLATLQGLLGFVFNTVILALTVNIGASLL